MDKILLKNTLNYNHLNSLCWSIVCLEKIKTNHEDIEFFS